MRELWEVCEPGRSEFVSRWLHGVNGPMDEPVTITLGYRGDQTVLCGTSTDDLDGSKMEAALLSVGATPPAEPAQSRTAVASVVQGPWVDAPQLRGVDTAAITTQFEQTRLTVTLSSPFLVVVTRTDVDLSALAFRRVTDWAPYCLEQFSISLSDLTADLGALGRYARERVPEHALA